jgi:hypothetical protein
MSQPKYLRVRNWDKFQHYKDRDPSWIKLYLAVLDDHMVDNLGDAKFGQLVKLWLYAARRGNSIPFDNASVGKRIGARGLRLEFFIDAGFLEIVRGKPAKKGERKWPSRYISKPMRALVLERDAHRCQHCNSNLWLEIDHILPVSKGGESVLDNLQTLCRSCNRAKRATLTHVASAERPATRKRNPRSLEGEGETEEEKERGSPNGRGSTAADNLFEVELELQKLLAAVIEKDDGTMATFRNAAQGLPIGAIAKVRESSTGKPARYATAALNSERKERKERAT